MKKSCLLGAVCVIFLMPINAVASLIASSADHISGNTTFPSTQSKVAGWDFTVDSLITINALGVWDSNQDGLSYDHDIAIYDNSGPLITSTTVSSGGSTLLVDKTRWVQIPEVELFPGVTYSIMASHMCISDANGGDSCALTFTFGPAVTYASGINHLLLFFSDNGNPLDLTAKDVQTLNNGYLGPNFAYLDEFAVAPVPPAVYLFGSGLLGLVGMARRKKAA